MVGLEVIPEGLSYRRPSPSVPRNRLGRCDGVLRTPRKNITILPMFSKFESGTYDNDAFTYRIEGMVEKVVETI